MAFAVIYNYAELFLSYFDLYTGPGERDWPGRAEDENVWAKDRHHRILALLEVSDYLSTDRLIEELRVSRESIRRDLIQLEAQGKVSRIHGGITRIASPSEPPFADRLSVKNENKRRIGIAAARLVKPGMICAIDAGSTTSFLASELAGIPGVTIVTNSIDVAQKIQSVQKNADVNLLGGRISFDVPATHGELTNAAMRRFFCDIAFFSPVALDPEKGATDYQLSEAEFARVMIAQSDRVVALADSSKLGIHSRVQICECNQVDLLITDRDALKKHITGLREAGIKDVIAE